MYGLLRIVIAKFPEPVDDFQVVILAFAAVGLVYGSLLAFRAPDIRVGDRVLVDGADGADHARALLAQRARRERRHPAVGRARARLGDALPARRHGRGADRHERVRRARRDGARAPGARDAADDGRDHRARGARLGRVRGRVPDPCRRLRRRLGLGRRRRRGDRARRDVHAAADLGRAAPRAAASTCATRRPTCAAASSRSSSRSSPLCSSSPPGRRAITERVVPAVGGDRARRPAP